MKDGDGIYSPLFLAHLRFASPTRLCASNGLAPVVAPLPPTLLPAQMCKPRPTPPHKRGSTCRGPGFHRLTPRSGVEPACCSSSRYDSCFVDMFLAIWISTSRLGPRSPKCSAGPWTYTECDFDLLALQVDLPLHHLMPNY